EEDAAALAWLEQHPPDGVCLPRRKEQRTTTVAYRREGTLKAEGAKSAGPKDKVATRPFVGLVAVDGPFGWTWEEPPPAEVVACLEALVADVSHLGTSETPARLRLDDVEPTHRRDPQADLFTGSGIDLDIAVPGRSDRLVSSYVAQQATPSLRDDRYATSEEPLTVVPPRVARVLARYVTEDEPQPPAPWQVVHLAQLDVAPPRPEQAVAWAVAAHKALCARLGDAPPLLTGVYPPGAPRPANRVALHLLGGPAAAAVGLPANRATVLAMVPADADPLEAAALANVMGGLDRLTLDGRTRRVVRREVRSAATFWPAPSDGSPRRWRSAVPFVPDTRPPRRRDWSLADAVQLGVGLVLRDRLDAPGGGAERYLALRDAAVGSGVVVSRASRVTAGRLTRYVHHVQPGTVVQPLDVTLETGELLSDRSLVALGQSRHLGGGLLVPDELSGPTQ
ncbi:MAG: type I-U CRISPR-associated protein Csb2, partial [Actinomycetota bacterium]|nr:type I-U CRISPR-associated protein Csb2 [Actinomycetota bacterium]